MVKNSLIVIAICCSLLTPAWAEEVVVMPEGQTMLILSATEQVEVGQDILVASLRYDFEAKTSKEVQEAINASMTKAIELVKDYSSLEVETGQYYVYPEYRHIKTTQGDSEQVIHSWRGSQTLIIKSKDSEEVLETTGKLQEIDFVMNGMDYQLSPQKYDFVRDGLVEKTIASLNVRAKRVGEALDKPKVDLVEVNISDSGYMPGPMYARAAKADMLSVQGEAAMTAPVAEPGKTMVSLTISAKAIVKP